MLLVQQAWAGRVNPVAMLVLIRMAVTSVDSHAEPFYSRGHEDLARFALGRDGELTAADLRAVQRAVHELRDVGAIYVMRRSSGERKDGPKTAKYGIRTAPATGEVTRRFLTPSPDEKRRVSRPTFFDADTRRKTSGRGVREELRTTEGGVQGVELLRPQPPTRVGTADDETERALRQLAAKGVRIRRFTRIDGEGRDDGDTQPPLIGVVES